MRADDHGGPTHSCSPLCPESTLPLEDRLDALREAAASARAVLLNVVFEACPGTHDPVQHRDHLPPWCPHCGRDNTGVTRGPRARV